MKVLITGAAGFIGFHLCQTLLEKGGFEIHGMDNLNDYYDVQLKYARLRQLGLDVDGVTGTVTQIEGSQIQFHKLDLGQREAILDLFEAHRYDVVVNLAAQAGVRYSLIAPEKYIESNVTGFLNILEACRAFPVQHLLFASTSSVYGLNENVPFEESSHTAHPVSLYAASKKSNELMAHSYAHLFKIPCTGLRFFTVYGPWGRPDMALFLFTKAILADEPINVFNNGDMIRDFTYVDDIVKGISALLDKAPSQGGDFDPMNPDPSKSSASFQLFNIGNNNPVNLMDFVRAIEKKLGKTAKLNYMPMQQGDVSRTFASTAKLQLYTGYKPDTEIEDGINAFIDWYLQFYKS